MMERTISRIHMGRKRPCHSSKMVEGKMMEGGVR